MHKSFNGNNPQNKDCLIGKLNSRLKENGVPGSFGKTGPSTVILQRSEVARSRKRERAEQFFGICSFPFDACDHQQLDLLLTGCLANPQPLATF